MSDRATAELRWRCRRGMRELDVLLERYLAHRWPVACAAERQAFASLLELSDPELAALCLGRAAVPGGMLGQVVGMLTHGPASHSVVEGAPGSASAPPALAGELSHSSAVHSTDDGLHRDSGSDQ